MAKDIKTVTVQSDKLPTLTERIKAASAKDKEVLRQEMQIYASDMMEQLLDIARNGQSDSARMQAISFYFDTVIGKPAQQIVGKHAHLVGGVEPSQSPTNLMSEDQKRAALTNFVLSLTQKTQNVIDVEGNSVD